MCVPGQSETPKRSEPTMSTTYDVSVNVKSGNMTTSRSFAVRAENPEDASQGALAFYTDRPEGEVSFTVTHAVEGYTPTVARVDVTPANDGDYSYVSVHPVWILSDGTEDTGSGWGVKDMRMARRLEAAILAGVVHSDPVERVRDRDGSHYVQARSNVLGRMMNADLRRLGF